MKRYIKSSFDKNIAFAPIAVYDSYIDYCYKNLQGYYSEKLNDEDYEENISAVKDSFEKEFNANFETTPVILAYIGFVEFVFFKVNGKLYHLNEFDEFDEVTDSWLESLGCVTPLNEIYAVV